METRQFVPKLMRSFPNWIYWRLETGEDGYPNKVPYSPNYVGHSSSNKPYTWSTFEKANSNFYSYNLDLKGLGFVFSKETGLVFIDVDHCFNDDGTATEIGEYFIKHFFNRTYMELSQSGTGIHIVAIGRIERDFKNSKTGVEAYTSGRFCAMTFNAICPIEPQPMQYELDEIFKKHKTAEKKIVIPKVRANLNMSERDVVERACSNSERFEELYHHGNNGIYKSDSEADLFLSHELAFWCNRDADAIYRILCGSAMYRKKWERLDYQKRTIGLACNTCEECLTEYLKRKEIERANALERYLLQNQRPHLCSQRA